MLGGELHGSAIAGGEFFGFVACASAPDGTDGVEDPLSGEEEAGSGLGVAGRAAAEFFAGAEEVFAGGAVDGSVDASAAEQGGVGGVDDGVHFKLRDVGLDDFEVHGLLVVRSQFSVVRRRLFQM